LSNDYFSQQVDGASALSEQHGFLVAVARLQHDPWPGQQQLPVEQQLTPAFLTYLTFELAAFAWTAGSQHDPWPGQQQSPERQQESVSTVLIVADVLS
jgi:hypothetical protein